MKTKYMIYLLRFSPHLVTINYGLLGKVKLDWSNLKSGSASLVYAVFAFMLCSNLMAQESWVSPQLGEGPFVRSTLLLDYNEDNSQRDSWHQVYWYENPTDLFQNNRFFETSGRINGNCASRSRIIFNWKTVSPCYNSPNPLDLQTAVRLNYAQVRYRRGGSLCLAFDQSYGTPVSFPVKIPLFLPPTPALGEYFTCPDGSVEITVNIQPDVVYQELPSQVVWSRVNPVTGERTILFTDNNVESTLKSTFKTNVGTNPLDIEVFEAQANKNFNDCIVEGASVLIPVTSSIGTPLQAPSPQIISNCDAQPVTITVPNEFGYDGVFWYRNIIDPNGPVGSLHDGFSYTYTPNDGLDQLFIEYYKQLESGCYIRSIRVPVAFISRPEFSAINLRSNNTIFDYRDFGESDCQLERGIIEQTTTPFYYDLPNPEGLSITEDIVQDFTNTFGVGECTEFTLQGTEPRWEVIRSSDGGLSEDFKIVTNALGEQVYRVCADNISSSQGVYGFKDYQLQIDFRGKFSLCGGDPDNTIDIDCTIPVRGAIVRVITREPGTVTDECNFPTEDIFNILVDVNNNCERQEFETVCNDNQPVRLGPTEAEVLAFFNSQGILGFNFGELSYSWSPASGLSNPNIANPEVNFQSTPNAVGTIQQYTLTITYNGTLPPLFGERPTYTFCSYVYKCGRCDNGPGVFDVLGIN